MRTRTSPSLFSFPVVGAKAWLSLVNFAKASCGEAASRRRIKCWPIGCGEGLLSSASFTPVSMHDEAHTVAECGPTLWHLSSQYMYRA